MARHLCVLVRDGPRVERRPVRFPTDGVDGEGPAHDRRAATVGVRYLFCRLSTRSGRPGLRTAETIHGDRGAGIPVDPAGRRIPSHVAPMKPAGRSKARRAGGWQRDCAAPAVLLQGCTLAERLGYAAT